MPTAICLACRTVLGPGEACEGGPHHRVVDLTTTGGQERLLAEVWGPNFRRRWLPRLTHVRRFGSHIGTKLDRWYRILDEIGDLSIFLAALTITLVASPFVLACNAIRRRREDRLFRMRLRPHGAVVGPALPPRPGRSGIAEGASVPSPLHHEPCLAFGIFLRARRPAAGSSGLLWQEMATSGFAVRLEDGQLARLPAGRIRFYMDLTRAREVAPEHARARLPPPLVAEVSEHLPLVPFDEAFEDVIRPGDRIALLSPFALREDPTGDRPSPRGPAPMALLPIGTPVLSRLG